MSRTISASTGKRYGLVLVCRTWCFPRSTVYLHREKALEPKKATARRGPTPKVSDQELDERIRQDLKASPFVGEGHRKVWARLRVLKGVRVSRKRVLRLMRENHLLSPRRGRRGEGRLHDGTITTDAPNLMWGTDAVKFETVDDGWVWGFFAVDHFNGECVGAHVSKAGNRFHALEPIRQGMRRYFGGAAADRARGLSLRMDHGSQYMSDSFIQEIEYWGIAKSWAFVEEPQTNGVVERFNHTVKEQIHTPCRPWQNRPAPQTPCGRRSQPARANRLR